MIILDCDDVLLDWVKQFRIWCKVQWNLDTSEAGPATRGMAQWLGVTDEKARSFIVEFNASREFAFLEPVEGARAAIDWLSRKYPLHVVTSCSTDAAVVQRRKQNLHAVFGDVFQSIKCLPLGAKKDDVLSSFAPSIWIEDNYSHAVSGVKAGHRAFLRRRSHNADSEAISIPEVTWFTDWSEVLVHIAGE